MTPVIAAPASRARNTLPGIFVMYTPMMLATHRAADRVLAVIAGNTDIKFLSCTYCNTALYMTP
jgi:hypothetical protein